jgi:hypothetical protein
VVASNAEPHALTAAVLVDGRDPYAMYTAADLTATGVRLRGPLLLEVGETFQLRLARGAHAADVTTTVVDVVRSGHESEMVVTFAAADAARVKPLVDAT